MGALLIKPGFDHLQDVIVGERLFCLGKRKRDRQHRQKKRGEDGLSL
jgi:hypothetical protein